LAWGFHFPVQVYLEEVEAALAPDGVVIIDLRRGLGQEGVVRERFEVVQSWPGRADEWDRLVLKSKTD
jgi:hypothetical protein